MVININGIILKSEKDVEGFINGIKRSWTYNKLSSSEKSEVEDLMRASKSYERADRIYQEYLHSLDYDPTIWSERNYTRE